jgi:dynein heavy chain
LDEWEGKVTPFERVLLLKVFRSEKIMFAVSNYVNQYLGKYYLEPPKTTMEILYEDSDPATPIIFVLSAGADPT